MLILYHTRPYDNNDDNNDNNDDSKICVLKER